VPAARVRTIAEVVADPQLASRNIIHRYDAAPSVPGAFGVPVAAFKFDHGGPQVDSAPPAMGEHNEAVLSELGYSKAEITGLRAAKVI
jgi:crotonobetainyl-CoA:carnitine CoA-transferase CaiB-like acyl-CoA transferase